MKIQLKDPEKFIEQLIRKGFSRRSLAGVAKIGETTVSLIINGERNPGPSTARKICAALECSFDDIFVIVKPEQSKVSAK